MPRRKMIDSCIDFKIKIKFQVDSKFYYIRKINRNTASAVIEEKVKTRVCIIAINIVLKL